ncbi:AraC family transcriptional regulator [Paenibacillus algorifonticola]|uniref:GyrI-like domain-containing protein n=1 Tax=Paenibacillus algorifonticola TaxID=684063 RepID=UPI003D26F814
MTYDYHILRVIAYIEQHLHAELVLDHLAGASGFSKFHFTRLFKALTGETTQEYIRKRRLTAAAQMLLATNKPLIEIAFTLGYGSQEAYTRAFKAYFGVTPHRYRMNGKHYDNLYKQALTTAVLEVKKHPAPVAPPRFVMKEACWTAGLALRGKIDNDSISRLWNHFYEQLELQPSLSVAEPKAYYGIESIHSTNQPFYLAGIELESAEIPPQLPNGWTAQQLSEQNYVVFELESLIECIPSAIDAIYKNELPALQVKPVRDYHFEYYQDDFKANELGHTFHLYIPIE